MNYYNDNDPFSAAWLRELVALQLIPDGHVDDRSILEIKPSDLAGYRQCHFFCGIAGWPMSLALAGWGDSPVWTGSPPCQPFSVAGKQRGRRDERHLWPDFFRLIRECRPPVLFFEQVANSATLGPVSGTAQRRADGPAETVWLDGVFADLEGEGYTCGSADVPACGIGAPHIRSRCFGVAYTAGDGSPAHEHEPGERPRPATPPAHSAERADASGRLVHPDGDRCLQGEPPSPPAGYGSPVVPTGCAGGHVAYRNEPGRLAPLPHGSTPPAGRHRSPWDDFELIPCSDGRFRRIEPGSCPLVARLPRGLVPGGDPGVAEAQATAEARRQRLRGYGNSIVPQLAAEFIRAFLDARTP